MFLLFSVVVWRSEMVAKFFIKVFLKHTDKYNVNNIKGNYLISHKQRELINKAVQSLDDINQSMGFRVISQQTLEMIMKEYISKYNSPATPGRNLATETWPPNRVTAPQMKPVPENVISINRPK